MKVTVPNDVLVQTLEGESVLLNLDSEQYFGLDEIGTAMWNLLCETGSVEETCDRMVALYDVEADRLKHDLNDLVRKLAEHGLVTVTET